MVQQGFCSSNKIGGFFTDKVQKLFRFGPNAGNI